MYGLFRAERGVVEPQPDTRGRRTHGVDELCVIPAVVVADLVAAVLARGDHLRRRIQHDNVQAINAIAEDAWIPVCYPGAVADPDTGAWISDAEVAEIPYTAFPSTDDPVTARLVVRRVKDANQADALFPSLALPPLLHQLHRTRRRRRHHPPPPRDHRNHLRRPDRRPTGPHPVRSVRRQLRLGAMRRDHPQPATCRRNPRRRPPRQSPRGNTAPHTGQRPRADNPPTTQTGPAPARPLALGTSVACTVAQHNRSTNPNMTTTIQTRRPEPTGKAGQTSSSLMPARRRSRSKANSSPHNVHRRIEAKHYPFRGRQHLMTDLPRACHTDMSLGRDVII